MKNSGIQINKYLHKLIFINFGKFKFIKILFILFFIFNVKTPINNVNAKDIEKISIHNVIGSSYVENIRIKINQKLNYEVDSYIKNKIKNNKLNSSYLVKLCHQYKIDITFVLAQGILESHLGTRGKATTTNSVWNVGTYDDGRIIYTYNNPNQSIEPYLKLLTRDYLIDKNLYNLIEDKGYKNLAGNRFASAKGYENTLRKLILKINGETSIDVYQKIYNLSNQELFKYFAPNENSLYIMK